jgi:hypothetical protein
MTGAMIKSAVDPSVEVVVTTFGLPRGGNEAWADFLDSNVRRFRALRILVARHVYPLLINAQTHVGRRHLRH